MKHQRNFFVSILKFILITAAVFILLLFVLCLLFSFFYKDIFLHFFQRDVSVGKVSFDVSAGNITFSDISWKIPDGESLLSADEIQIKPDFKKLLKLQLVVKEVVIDGVKTFVIQNGNAYKLPPFMPEKKNSTANFKIPKIPITFSGITLSNTTVNLRRNGKDYRFLSELNINLPTISDGISEIKPVISGNFNRKPFKFTGSTKFNENADIINRFQISSKNLNIAENKFFLPVFPGISMEQGIINFDIGIEYIIRKKTHKSSLVFNGNLSVRNLSLRTNAGQIASRLTGSAVVKRYDFTQKQLDVKSLSVTGGNINLPKEIFAAKKRNGTKPFQISIDNSLVKNISLSLPDMSLTNIAGNVSNFSQTLKNTAFDLSANMGKGLIKVKGTSNGISEFEFDNLIAENICLPNDLPAAKKIKDLKSLNIEKIYGNARLQLTSDKKPLIDFSGTGFFSDINCKFDDKQIDAKNITLAVRDLNTNNRSGVLKELQFSGLSFKSKQTYLSECNFVLAPGAHALKITENFSIDNNWEIKELSFIYGEKEQIYTTVNNTLLNLKLQINKKQFSGETSMQIGDIGVYHNGILSARLRNADVQNAKISNNKNLRLNIDQAVYAKYIYLKTTLSDTASIKIAGIPLFTIGRSAAEKSKSNMQIHLSRLNVSDGEIDFIDDRKSAVPFSYAFTDISWKSNNIPSFIYPQGNLELSGKVDKSNPFSLQLTVGATEIKGSFSCSNALLPPFSEYAQKYLGHSIRNGRLSMRIPFSITDEKISSDVSLQLFKPELKRLSTSSFPLNLEKVLKAMTDRSGMIDLKFPVTVLLEEKKVKYIDLFFEILSKTLQSSAERLSAPIREEIIYDDVFSIVYFKGGSTQISGNNFLSEKMLEKIDSRRNVFAINGFVDKQNDTEYLKRELAAKMLKKYMTDEGESARRKALQQLLELEYNESVSENEDSEMLLQKVLEHLTISQEDFRALAFARANTIADYLAENYSIPLNKIYVREDDNLFENPYISGISNSIAVIRSGKLVE